MYAAAHLLGIEGGTFVDGRTVPLSDRKVEVDMFERLSTPWGLVRGGVAPDHQDKKLMCHLFESVATRPEFRFHGNVEIGTDVTADELSEWFDAVIYAVGASDDQSLGIPGEQLAGSLPARRLVGWYNGHPDQADLDVDFGVERAVVVGNGNAALDVAGRSWPPRVGKKAPSLKKTRSSAATRRAGVRDGAVLWR
ncbi:hypothetical protein [Mycolicibacterium chitae]|nr:hypothetical protein [Mycolicibacterium chitae]